MRLEAKDNTNQVAVFNTQAIECKIMHLRMRYSTQQIAGSPLQHPQCANNYSLKTELLLDIANAFLARCPFLRLAHLDISRPLPIVPHLNPRC